MRSPDQQPVFNLVKGRYFFLAPWWGWLLGEDVLLGQKTGGKSTAALLASNIP